MKGKSIIEDLREAVEYDPTTGEMWWVKPYLGRKLFVPFGSGSSTQYVEFGFKGEIFLLHRAAWAITHGFWANEIDHINRNKRDNRIANLRAVTRSENCINTGLRRDNRSGCKGVNWFKAAKAWRAYITRGGIRSELDYFKEKADAILARKQAEQLLDL